ncbi:hypothetical protein ACFHYQ_07845 [Sphaerimonospora cavernae]|uniref:Uncharacterized protein n=1 Tax=Sphaerimonospora cavernae TaxID=1740611 RepID=A0ABV6U4Z6_9ACTN
MTGSRSLMRSLALAAVAVLGASSLSTGTAHAQPLTLLQCQGIETVTYNPGVTFQQRDIDMTIDAQFNSCIDGAGEVTSGSYGNQATVFVGCNELLGGFEGKRTVTWSTGDTSVIEESGSSTAVAGQVITTTTGKVVQGRFQGRSTLHVSTLPQPGLLQCLTTGFTSATGVTTLTIT